MKKTIKDFSLDFKTVILRCDLNVTIKDNKIVDDTRIKESLETIKYILDNNAKVVILSHLGKIKTEEDKEKNNLKIVCDRLNYYLDNKITFVEYDYDVKKIIDDCYEKAQKIVSKEKKLVEILANRLIVNETLTKEEIEDLVEANSNYKVKNDEEVEKDTAKKAKKDEIKNKITSNE